jgi:hypothetical protein
MRNRSFVDVARRVSYLEEHGGSGEYFEIGRILHLKSEIRNRKLDWLNCAVQFDISDLGFEMQDSSDFKMSSLILLTRMPSADKRSGC